MGIRTVYGKEPHRLLPAGLRPTVGRIAVCGKLFCNCNSTRVIYTCGMHKSKLAGRGFEIHDLQNGPRKSSPGQ